MYLLDLGLFKHSFHMDSLARVMSILVSIIGINVFVFSQRFMQGDRYYQRFLCTIVLLCCSTIMMVNANTLWLLLITWSFSNYCLVQLMVYKPQWQAARVSGQLAARNFIFGFLSLLLAFSILYMVTGHSHISKIVSQPNPSPYISVALLLILLSAMRQSAIFPFHGWLLSSLNSPTPASALMHAGIVNGGGFLLIRFAPLYLKAPYLLHVIFVVGIFSAILGTIWKLLQHDVKRMLACSTMGQMGFMFVQCSLGLFSAAAAHLCWHGFFKAYLFLSSGAAAQEKRLDVSSRPTLSAFLLAIPCSLAGSYGFALLSNKNWPAIDTSLVLVIIVFITLHQCALAILATRPFKRFSAAFLFAGVAGTLYGLNVYLAESLFTSALLQPQPLTPLHVIGVTFIVIAWLSLLFFRKENRKTPLPDWALKLYVKLSNSSQPHPRTITTHRNDYTPL